MNFDRKFSTGLFGAIAIIIGLLPAMAAVCNGQGIQLESAGGRFGFYPSGASEHFHQAEGFATWALPWDWDLGSLWRLQSRLDISAGWLGDSSVNAAIFTVGPTLCVRRQSFSLSVELGVSPTLLTRSDFPSKDFGIPFQFTSHGGVNWDVTSRVRLSYRFQHMSNADLARHNPGLNLHMFGLSYLF